MAIDRAIQPILRMILMPLVVLALGACDEPTAEAEKGPMQEIGEDADEILEKAEEKSRELLDETGERLEEAGKDLQEVGKELQSD